MKRKYPEKVIYMISGEELNKAISCVHVILNTFEEGSEDYRVVDNLLIKLNKKTSYEELLDMIGIPKVEGGIAPKQKELEWYDFLGSFGLKPPLKK